MTKQTVIAAALAAALSSCGATGSLYSWHDYEDAAYQYGKRTTDKSKQHVLRQYRLMAEKQDGLRGTPPPGLNAEYGYLLYTTGRRQEGLELMKKETALYPESEKYISRIIKQLEK